MDMIVLLREAPHVLAEVKSNALRGGHVVALLVLRAGCNLWAATGRDRIEQTPGHHRKGRSPVEIQSVGVDSLIDRRSDANFGSSSGFGGRRGHSRVTPIKENTGWLRLAARLRSCSVGFASACSRRTPRRRRASDGDG